jgi:thiol-disulfide isomerase/thioredoxin
MEALMARMMAEGPSAKRPPHWSCWTRWLRFLRCGTTRRRALALAAGATLAAALPARQAGAQVRQAGGGPPKPAPAFAFTDARARNTARRTSRAGLVVNLWATWCPPCVAEMPALDRAQAALAEEGVRVLALSSDREGRAKVEPFYRDRGIRHLGLWLDPRGAAQRALGRARPAHHRHHRPQGPGAGEAGRPGRVGQGRRCWRRSGAWSGPPAYEADLSARGTAGLPARSPVAPRLGGGRGGRAP